MPDLTKLLDQIDRLDKSATKGPWVYWEDAARSIVRHHQSQRDGSYIGMERVAMASSKDADAELIALARTALPALGKAIRAVLSECDRFQRNATALQENPLADHSDDVRAESWRVMASFITEAITDALGE